MKLRILAVLPFIILIGCSKSPQDKISDLMDAGYGHMESFEFEKAQEAFNQAAALVNGYPYDRFGKGLILEQQLFYYEALNEYLYLALIYPDSVWAYGGIYRIYTQFGYHDWALEAATKYLELAPQSEDAALAKIQSLFNCREFIKARQEIESSTGQALDKNTAACLMAFAHGHLNEFDSASTYLKQALAAPLTSPAQYSFCAEALQLTGLIDSAMILSRQAVSAKSAPVSAIYRHFERALTNNYYGDARQMIKLLEQKGAGKEITSALNILIAKDQKNFTKSRVLEEDYINSTPKNVSSLMFSMATGGTQYADLQSLMHFESMVELFLNSFNYNAELKTFVKAQIEIFKGQSKDLASALEELSRLEGPLARTRQVILMLPYLQYRTAQFEPALKRLRELRVTYSNNPDWLTEIADIYAHPSINLFDTAQKIYEEVLNNDKWHKQAFKIKVQNLLSRGSFGEALHEFEKFPHFEENFHDLAMLKAICLCENDDFIAAFSLCQNRGVYLKGNLEPFREMATIMERKYRDKEILQLAQMCAGRADDNVDILMLAARLLADQKDFSATLALSEKALIKEPELLEASVHKGRALYGLGQRTQAFELFEETLKKDPGEGDSPYYFSNILAREKIDHARTTNMARTAVRAFYSDEKGFINLCQVYDAFGDHKFAYGEAAKGSMEFPKSAQLWYQLGLAAHHLGRANAEENLKKAIELGLGGEDLKKAKEILSKL